MDLQNIDRDKFFQVALASSVVLFGFDGNEILIYIHQQQKEPHKGFHILPSNYILPQSSNEKEIRKLIFKNLSQNLIVNSTKAIAIWVELTGDRFK